MPKLFLMLLVATLDSVSALARMMDAAMLGWGLMLWSARRFDQETKRPRGQEAKRPTTRC